MGGWRDGSLRRLSRGFKERGWPPLGGLSCSWKQEQAAARAKAKYGGSPLSLRDNDRYFGSDEADPRVQCVQSMSKLTPWARGRSVP